MGIILGWISISVIVLGVYFRISNQKKVAKSFIIAGSLGMVVFIYILIRALFEV